MGSQQKGSQQFSSSYGFYPQEEMLESKVKGCKLRLGIPRERAEQEKRVALIPEAVEMLVQNGHEVLVEHGAGEDALFPDKEYSDAGAQIKYDAREVYSADIILKVAPPVEEEIELIEPRKVIFTSLHWRNHPQAYYKNLIAKKITGFAFEKIKDQDGVYPLIRAMSEIAGNKSIMLAAEYLSSTKYGRGSIFGGFTGLSPTSVVILGAGTVGEYATYTALGMGAAVKVFDNNISRLRRIQQLQNQRIYTSMIQPKRLKEAIEQADVVIGAMRPVDGRTPVVVCEEMVRQMKKGAVIIDVSIDHGGVCETSQPTTHKQPVYQVYGVTHYCVPNIPSQVARTASEALSNFFAPILMAISEQGGVDEVLKKEKGLRNGVYIFKGILTDKNIAKKFNLSFHDIELILAAFH